MQIYDYIKLKEMLNGYIIDVKQINVDQQTEKWIVAISLGILFLVFSSKFIYLYINMFTIYAGKNIFTTIGCVKSTGIFISAILFTLTLYIILTLFSEDTSYNDNIMVIALLVGTIFFLLNLNSIYYLIETIKNTMLFRNNNEFTCERSLFSQFFIFVLFVLIVRLLLSF